MRQGEVKKFNELKGFGFISDNESGKEHFFHIKNCIGYDPKNRGANLVSEGTKVEFKLKENPRGDEAIEVNQI